MPARFLLNFTSMFFFVMPALTATAQDNKLTERERKEGWQLLFDGKSTAGWKGAFLDAFPAKGWRIENNVLLVEPSGGAESTNGGDIVTLNDYGDFDLRVDFKITEGANSGIKYFVDAAQPKPADPRSAIGLEFQILDDARHPDAKLGKNGNRTIGSLYDLITAAADKPVHPIGEWNTARVIAVGNHVEHWLNGAKVLEYERGGTAFQSLVAGSKYKDIAGFGLIARGRILLQDHGNKVFYKNIKIRPLITGISRFGKTLTTPPGMVSYTFRNSFKADVAATLDTIKRYGVSNLEFSNLFGKGAAELRALLVDRDMRCTSFGVSYEEAVNRTAEVIQNAKALGASFVRVAWIPHDNKVPFTLETAKKAAADFNAVGKRLKDAGLTFCYHNHGYEFGAYEGGTYFDYLVANTNPDCVSFEMDIFWVVHPGKNPVELLKKYPSRFKLMHVKDLRKGVAGNFSGGTDVNNDVALGRGQIDIAAVLKAAKKTGIEHFYLEDESDHVHAQVPQSIAYLKGL